MVKNSTNYSSVNLGKFTNYQAFIIRICPLNFVIYKSTLNINLIHDKLYSKIYKKKYRKNNP